MKRITWSVLAGLGAAGLLVAGSTIRADEGKSKDSSTGSSSASDSSSALKTYPDAAYMNDVVKEMDMPKHEITLAGSDKPVRVSENCKVTKNGKTASMSDVKEGEKIRAAMTGKGDSARIVEIWVIEPTGTGSSSK